MWIPTIILILVLMYSKIGEHIIKVIKKLAKWLLYDSNKPRRWIWTRFYEVMSWVYPDDSFYIMNSGYALLSSDGLLNKFEPFEHENKEIFQYQLYYAVVRLLGKNIIKDKKVVDLSCGRGGGTFFLYAHYKPK